MYLTENFAGACHGVWGSLEFFFYACSSWVLAGHSIAARLAVTDYQVLVGHFMHQT
jgi:hypothetical protein